MYNNFDCSVLDEGETTEWFQVQSELKQGCVMSGFLFLLAIDWGISSTTEGRRTDIRWKFTSVLEILDYTYDIALLSSWYVDIRGRLTEEAERVDQKSKEVKSHASEYQKRPRNRD